MFLSYPSCRHKPSRATPLKPRGFQRGPQAPLAVPRASELAAAFSLPFWPVKKEGGMASEGTVPYRAEPGFAPLPKNVLIRQTATAGSRPRPTNGRKRSVYPQPPRGHLPLPGGMYASPTNKGTAYTSRKRSRKADVHGGVKTPPYKPTGNGRQNDQADICHVPLRRAQKPDKNCTFVQCKNLPGVQAKTNAAPCKLPCRGARRSLHKNFFGRPP